MADRLAVFNEGRIAQIGTPEEVYARPRTRFVADFVGSSNVLPPEVTRMLGGPARWSSLRPESLSLVAPAGALASGPVTGLRYLGAGSRVSLNLPGCDLAVLVGPGQPVPSIGDTVGISFPPEALHAMDDA